MSAIRINGIRVGHQMFHLRQYPESKDFDPSGPLYRTLAEGGINSPCIGGECNVLGKALSCCIEEDRFKSRVPVCMVSVYPHGSNSAILGFLISLFGRNSLPFFHMVSSNAMISFVIAQAEKERVLSLLEQTFDLPPTHTPYEPGFHEETAAFVKKRYQETRAYFREQKIKTYGFDLTPDLDLKGSRCGFDDLEHTGDEISKSDSKFYFATAFGHTHENTVTLYRLVREPQGGPVDDSHINIKADMVFFHGPHFGDRYGIFDAGVRCLEAAGIEFLLAGCTGASVTLVFEAGKGEEAITALKKGFEIP